jgi:hypothetical protein
MDCVCFHVEVNVEGTTGGRSASWIPQDAMLTEEQGGCVSFSPRSTRLSTKKCIQNTLYRGGEDAWPLRVCTETPIGKRRRRIHREHKERREEENAGGSGRRSQNRRETLQKFEGREPRITRITRITRARGGGERETIAAKTTAHARGPKETSSRDRKQ